MCYLHRSVVVVKVDSSDHLGSLEIADTQIDFRDDVTSDQLEDLSRRGKSGIHFDPRQLQSLRIRELFESHSRVISSLVMTLREMKSNFSFRFNFSFLLNYFFQLRRKFRILLPAWTLMVSRFLPWP